MPNPIAPSAALSAINGIRRGTERFNRPAEDVAVSGAGASSAAVLEISPEARTAAASGVGAGLEEALVEQSVAKHQVVANVKTLQTVNEMNKEVLDLLG